MASGTKEIASSILLQGYIDLNQNDFWLNTDGDSNNKISTNGTDTVFTANRSLGISTAVGVGSALSISSSVSDASLAFSDSTSGDGFSLLATQNKIRANVSGTSSDLVFPVNTLPQTYTLPQDKSGIFALTTDIDAIADDITIAFNTAGELEVIDIDVVNKTKLINVSSTGLREGGVLTKVIGTTPNPDTLDITAGSGVIVDNYTDPNNPVSTQISWSAFTNVSLTFLATDAGTYILIKPDGTLLQLPVGSPPTAVQKS